jgi:hypothetical protein
VNWVKNTIDWWWDGSQVAVGTCGDQLYWLNDGWSVVSSTLYCDYDPVAPQYVSHTYAHFKNPYFCASIDTDVYYDRNNAQGGGNGALSGYVYVHWTGGCSSLIGPTTYVVRTLN